MGVVLSNSELRAKREELRKAGNTVVFTNGVFDILHRGHCEYLAEAKAFGDVLIIGLNSDASVRRIKGDKKPIVPESDRAYVLSMLACVDFVSLFDEDTPQRLIAELLPNVLVKGGDYALDEIVGREEVEQAGGRVCTVPLTPDRSSTNIIQTILDRFCT
jgi:rfaE bifunctional protein nucleotidyltransferase chain/domain